MPVGAVVRRERPSQRLPTQTALHVIVHGHVDIVVVVDEGMALHRQVQQDGAQDKSRADQYRMAKRPRDDTRTPPRCRWPAAGNRCWMRFSFTTGAGAVAHLSPEVNGDSSYCVRRAT